MQINTLWYALPKDDWIKLHNNCLSGLEYSFSKRFMKALVSWKGKTLSECFIYKSAEETLKLIAVETGGPKKAKLTIVLIPYLICQQVTAAV